MTHTYSYIDRADASALHSDRRRGPDFTGLTPGQAAARYALESDCPTQAFGIMLLTDDEDQPHAWLQMSPRARRVVLRRMNAHGSVATSFEWACLDAQSDSDADDDAVFLQRLTWYAYPGEPRFFEQSEAVGTVTMEFTPDGHATRQRVTEHSFLNPNEAEISEYSDVDITANWVRVPEFGHWEEFFDPIAA